MKHLPLGKHFRSSWRESHDSMVLSETDKERQLHLTQLPGESIRDQTSSPKRWRSLTLPETNIAPENGWLEY